MKKEFLLAALAALALCLPRPAMGQNPSTGDSITVSYEYPDDKYLRGMMHFSGIHCFDVKLKSTAPPQLYKLQMVRCTDGKTERTDMFGGMYNRLDSINSFLFFAQAESADTVHISCSGRMFIEQHIPIPTQGCILMETLPVRAYTPADTIPLIAYTTGHQKETVWHGQKGTYIDFCEVRFSKTHPSEWHEKFGIKDYLYFDLIMQPYPEPEKDETSPKP